MLTMFLMKTCSLSLKLHNHREEGKEKKTYLTNVFGAFALMQELELLAHVVIIVFDTLVFQTRNIAINWQFCMRSGIVVGAFCYK